MVGLSNGFQALNHHQDAKYVEHEEEVSRHPYSIRGWLNYFMAAKEAKDNFRYHLYERALQIIPRSYKIWKLYLDEKRTQMRGQRIDLPGYKELVTLYERALMQLNKMPRIWLDYLSVLIEMKLVTSCRHAFDRALRALPITQHHRIWPLYLEFVKEIDVPQTAISVYRRYLMLEPTGREEFIEYLCTIDQYEEASNQLVVLLNDEKSNQYTKKTNHALWMQLCDMISQHPEEISQELNVDAILRTGIAQFSDEVGRLWCSLATYYIRLGMFESARDIYEESIQKVMTVRDFSMLFDAYVKFIEALVTAEMELAEEKDEQKNTNNHKAQVDRLLKIYEDIADRRPLLLNSVLLRQNPNNIREWEKRIELVKSCYTTKEEEEEEEDKVEKDSTLSAMAATDVIRTYAEAVKTIDPSRSGGRFHVLWIQFAKFYEKFQDLENTRAIFQRATQVNFQNVEELANIYCEWSEMEIRHDHFDKALDLLRQACTPPPNALITKNLKKKKKNFFLKNAKEKLYKNIKLWNARVDLEESLGDLNSTRQAYDLAFELKVITTQMVIQYANFLQEKHFFEESFCIYERGLCFFSKFPYAANIWREYLKSFVQRYQGTKIERTRDLHEQAIRACLEEEEKEKASSSLPFIHEKKHTQKQSFIFEFYEKYAEFEEKYGMLRNVMTLYERAVKDVPSEQQLMLYIKYIQKAQTFFGIQKIREIYEKSMDLLKREEDLAEICMRFALMESKMGEIERARAIFTHGAQFCDPKQKKWEETFWKKWQEFEVVYGNEHSFLEMLRVKRSVSAQFAQEVHITSLTAPMNSTTTSNSTTTTTTTTIGASEKDAMASLEMQVVVAEKQEQEQASEQRNNVGLKRKAVNKKYEEEMISMIKKKKPIVQVTNEEEIDLDDEYDDNNQEDQEKDKEEEDTSEIVQKELPATLFGNTNSNQKNLK